MMHAAINIRPECILCFNLISTFGRLELLPELKLEALQIIARLDHSTAVRR